MSFFFVIRMAVVFSLLSLLSFFSAQWIVVTFQKRFIKVTKFLVTKNFKNVVIYLLILSFANAGVQRGSATVMLACATNVSGEVVMCTSDEI